MQKGAFDSSGKSYGRCLWPPTLLHQIIVATTTGQTALLAPGHGRYFKSSPAVIVQPTDKSVVFHERKSQVCQCAFDHFMMILARLANSLTDRSESRQQILNFVILGIKKPQGIQRYPILHSLRNYVNVLQ